MTLVADLSGTSRRLVCDQTLSATLVCDPGLRQSLVWSGRSSGFWPLLFIHFIGNTMHRIFTWL